MVEREFTDVLGDVWLVFICVVCVLLAIVVICAVGVNHRVVNYYIGNANDIYNNTTCVYASEPWETDDKVFCSKNPQEVIDFANKANSVLKGVK